MSKLKLDAIPDDKPVRLTIKMPAHVHRDLVEHTDVPAFCGGHVMMTRSDQATVLEQVRTFSAFSTDNDPHGERDF